MEDYLSLEEAIRFAERAEEDLHGRVYEVASEAVLRLVKDSGHSSYDCEYVALAEALETQMVSGDRKTAKQFPDTVVLLEGFAT